MVEEERQTNRIPRPSTRLAAAQGMPALQMVLIRSGRQDEIRTSGEDTKGDNGSVVLGEGTELLRDKEDVVRRIIEHLCKEP